MPYLIVAKVEPGTEVMGRICHARVAPSNDGLLVHVLVKRPFVATILRNPGWTRSAWTYQIEPSPGEGVGEIHGGPYPDLSTIREAVERYTGETCAIRVSAQMLSYAGEWVTTV